MYHANTNQKKAGLAILIPDKVNFRPAAITRPEDRHTKGQFTKST